MMKTSARHWNHNVPLAFVLVILELLLSASQSQARHRFINLSQSPGNSTRCAIASSPDGALVVAWVENGSQVWTRCVIDELVQEAVLQGPGDEPAICWCTGGFLLAYTSGTTMVTREGDGRSWEEAKTIQSLSGGDLYEPDLGAPSGPSGEVYLTWREQPGENPTIVFSRRLSEVWQVPELVQQVGPYESPCPQVEPYETGGMAQPRVYFFEYMSALDYREHDGTAWSAIQQVPASGFCFGMDMDVSTGSTPKHQLLSLDCWPLCNCVRIHFHEERASGEWEAEDITAHVPGYPDFWSGDPTVAVSDDGVTHAFWNQWHERSSAPPTHLDAMYYRTRDPAGGWTDCSEILEGHVGIDNDLVLDPRGRPVFVWAEFVNQNRDVFLAFQPSILFVKPDGTGDYRTIQEAIDAAGDGDVVELEDGTFRGSGNRDLDYHGKRITVRSRSGDPERCIIDCEGGGRGFWFHSAEGPGSVLRGVEVTGGYVEGFGVRGGGIRCVGCSPTILDCVIRSNQASGWAGGGGISFEDCSCRLERCRIVDNQTAGCYYCGGWGGGIACTGGSLMLVDCTVTGNATGDVEYGGPGGGIHCTGTSTAIIGGSISSNRGVDSGGGIHFDGPSLSIHGTTISGNIAYGMAQGRGGGICFGGDSLIVEDAIITGNTASVAGGGCSGGGIDATGGLARLLRTTITGNSVAREWEATTGGGIECGTSILDLESCTITGNTSAGTGGGIGGRCTRLQCERTILWGNCAWSGGDEACLTADSLLFACSDVDSAGLAIDGAVLWEESNIQEDPFFCDPEDCVHAPTTGGIYQLADTSPCAPDNSPQGCRLIGALDVGCTSAAEEEPTVPARVEIRPPSPNPTACGARITFGVPRSVAGERVIVCLYDPAGRLLRTLTDAPRPAGIHTVAWNGRDEEGRRIADGAYFVQIRTRLGGATERLIVLH